jgi:hypothetical protein
MKVMISLLVTASIATPIHSLCMAQKLFSDDQTKITREEWLRRVENSRQRLKAIRSENRGLISTKSYQEVEQENSHQATSDDSLKPGDIVSTTRGLMIFKGRSEDQGSIKNKFVAMQLDCSSRDREPC